MRTTPWIHPEATCADGSVSGIATVKANAMVDGQSHVGGRCVIGSNAQITNGAIVGGSAHVGDSAVLDDEAVVMKSSDVISGHFIGKVWTAYLCWSRSKKVWYTQLQFACQSRALECWDETKRNHVCSELGEMLRWRIVLDAAVEMAESSIVHPQASFEEYCAKGEVQLAGV